MFVCVCVCLCVCVSVCVSVFVCVKVLPGRVVKSDFPPGIGIPGGRIFLQAFSGFHGVSSGVREHGLLGALCLMSFI